MFDVLPEVRDGFDDVLPWWVEQEAEQDDGFGLLAEVAQRPVGPWLITGLANVDRSSLSAHEALTHTQLVEQGAAWLAGLLAASTAETFDALTQLAEVDDADPAPFLTAAMTASAEMAAALRVAPRTADRRIQQAVDLAGPIRPLRDAMIRGEVSAAHVAAVSRELDRLPAAGNPALAHAFAEQCAEVLAVIVPFAASHTPGEAARKTRMLVSAIDPAAVRERRREIAERQHGVYLAATEPGTCEITAVMPIAYGHAVVSAVNALAAHEDFEVAAGCVTIGQRRVAARGQAARAGTEPTTLGTRVE